MIKMLTITRKSFERTTTHPQLGGAVRNLRYTEVVNQFETVETDAEGTPETIPAESLVLFSSIHFER